ncbi:hypothetical protein TWF281_007079 [Arthrobotrys megalospora]
MSDIQFSYVPTRAHFQTIAAIQTNPSKNNLRTKKFSSPSPTMKSKTVQSSDQALQSPTAKNTIP